MSYDIETLFVLLKVIEFEDVRDKKKDFFFWSYDTMI